MENILKDLYFGELRPNADFCPDDPSYQKALAQIDGIESQMKTFPENERKHLKEVIDSFDEVIGIVEEASFVRGFQLGSRITAQALLD